MLAHVHARDDEMPGLIHILSRNIERIAPGAYFRSIDSALHGHGASQTYTTDALVAANKQQLEAVLRFVNTGHLLDLDFERPEEREIAAMLTAAVPVTQIPIKLQWKLAADITNTDEPGIVAAVSKAVLRCGGTWHRFHGETINSGRYDGTADFYISGLVGFANHARAEAAFAALRALPYDVIKLVRLYGLPGLAVPAARAA
jgi:hypothetical protein